MTSIPKFRLAPKPIDHAKEVVKHMASFPQPTIRKSPDHLFTASRP